MSLKTLPSAHTRCPELLAVKLVLCVINLLTIPADFLRYGDSNEIVVEVMLICLTLYCSV